ncbi:MAG: uL22 family ribosomal protein [Candidatus Aenigmatarchaeota archaeon]
MERYAFNPNPKKSVRVYGRSLRLSEKNSAIVCRRITGMNLEKAKKLLEDMISGRRSIDGKYYTNISKEILSLLKSGESNAENKGLDTSRLYVHASAHKGFTFMRPRRLKMRGTKRKMANIQIVLMER